MTEAEIGRFVVSSNQAKKVFETLISMEKAVCFGVHLSSQLR
jgi:hypothetical protein